MGNQRKIASQQGMGLLEIVIGLGVMTIIGLGMASLSLNANKAQKGIAQKNESLLVQTEIQGVLSSSAGMGAEYCAANLGIAGLAFSDPALPAPVTPALAVKVGGVTYHQGDDFTPSSGLKFKKLRLKNGFTVGAQELRTPPAPALPFYVKKLSGSIEFQMEKTASGVAAGTGSTEFRPIEVPILLFVTAPGNIVYDCGSHDTGYSAGLCSDELDGFHNAAPPASGVKCSLRSMSFSDLGQAATNDLASAAYRVKIQDKLAILSPVPVLPTLPAIPATFPTVAFSQLATMAAPMPALNSADVGYVTFVPRGSMGGGLPAWNQLILTPNGSKTAPGEQMVIDEQGFVSQVKFKGGIAAPTNLNVSNTVNIGNDLNVASVSTLNSAVISTFNMTSGNIASLTAGAITVTGSQTIAGNLDVTGNLTQTTGTLGVTSDIRLKTDIEPLQDNLAKILKIDPIKFQYIAKKTKEGNIGFSAQNVQEFFPELVRTNDKGYLSVAYANMTAVLVGAIKEFFEKWQTQDRIQTEAVKELALQAKDLERKQAERFAKLEAEIKSLREEIKSCKKK